MKLYDPIYGEMELKNPWEIEIVNSPRFRRLQRIKQMSFAYLIFPGANHTRFEHSLGTYKLASIFWDILKTKEIDHIAFDRDDEIKLKLSALLHDMGHGPLSHLVEIFMSRLGLKYGHEVFAIQIIMDELPEILRRNGIINADKICEDVVKIITKNNDTKDIKICFFGNLISGHIDFDRLDFLQRDSYYCHSWRLNVDLHLFFTKGIKIMNIDGMPDAFLNGNTGISDAEEILMFRRNIYKNIVNDRNYLSATAMALRAMKNSVSVNKPNNVLYNLTQRIENYNKLDLNQFLDEFRKEEWYLELGDSEFLDLLYSVSTSNSIYIDRLRKGNLFKSIDVVKYNDLTNTRKDNINKLYGDKKNMQIKISELEDKIEKLVINKSSIGSEAIIVYAPPLPNKNEMFINVIIDDDEKLNLMDASPISKVLGDDLLQNWGIHLFADMSSNIDVHQIKKVFRKILSGA